MSASDDMELYDLRVTAASSWTTSGVRAPARDGGPAAATLTRWKSWSMT